MAEFKSRGFVSEFEFPIFPKHGSLQLVIRRINGIFHMLRSHV